MVLGHADRDHIFLNMFPKVNPGIVAVGNDIEAAVVRDDFEYDVWIFTRCSRLQRDGQPRAFPSGYRGDGDPMASLMGQPSSTAAPIIGPSQHLP